jgi:hypothetical protein
MQKISQTWGKRETGGYVGHIGTDHKSNTSLKINLLLQLVLFLSVLLRLACLTKVSCTAPCCLMQALLLAMQED